MNQRRLDQASHSLMNNSRSWANCVQYRFCNCRMLSVDPKNRDSTAHMASEMRPITNSVTTRPITRSGARKRGLLEERFAADYAIQEQ